MSVELILSRMLAAKKLADALPMPARVPLDQDAREIVNAIASRVGMRPFAGCDSGEALGAFDRIVASQLALDGESSRRLREWSPSDVELRHLAEKAKAESLEGVFTRREIRRPDGAVLVAYTGGCKDGDPVVVVPACGMPIELCERWIRELAKTAFVLTWETRGMFGPEVNFDALDTSVRAQCEDLIAVMDSAGVERAHVMGLCGGAVIALDAAATFPERCTSLSLWYADVNLAGVARTKHQSELLALLAMARESRTSAAGLQRLFTDPKMLSDVRADVAHVILYPYADAELLYRYGVLNGAIMEAEVAPLLASIVQPVVVVTSEDDATTNPDGSRALRTALSNARLHVEPHGDHLTLFDAQPHLVELALEAIAPKEKLPLTSGQRAIWFDQLLNEGQPLYNMSGCLRIFGAVDRERFERACDELVRRHDALRLVLRGGSEMPTQEILGSFAPPLRYLDYSEFPDGQERARAWMNAEIDKPPRLFDGPLFDFALIKIADDEYWWFHTYHHLIVDAYAHSLLVSSLADIYSGAPDDGVRHSFVRYVRAEAEAQDSARWAEDLEYWKGRFASLPEPMVERKRFGEEIEQRRHVVTLPRAFYRDVDAFAARCGVSTFHVLLGALYAYFTRAGRRDDFVIGLPTLNRPSAAFKATVGLFTNVTPSWFMFGGEITVHDLLKAISSDLRRDYRHQRIPLSEINRVAGLHRHGRAQMFDIVLTYQKHSYDVRFDGLRVEQISLRHGLKTPLMIEVSEYNDELDVDVNLDYSLSAFSEEEIAEFGKCFVTTIEALVNAADVRLADVPIDVGERAARTIAGDARVDVLMTNAPARTGYSPAQIEERLLAIWRDELKSDAVGVRDNIFDLGGHSLLLVRVAHRIAQELGCTLTMTQMFMYPTIEALTGALCGRGDHDASSGAAAERGAMRRRAMASRTARR